MPGRKRLPDQYRYMSSYFLSSKVILTVIRLTTQQLESVAAHLAREAPVHSTESIRHHLSNNWPNYKRACGRDRKFHARKIGEILVRWGLQWKKGPARIGFEDEPIDDTPDDERQDDTPDNEPEDETIDFRADIEAESQQLRERSQASQDTDYEPLERLQFQPSQLSPQERASLNQLASFRTATPHMLWLMDFEYDTLITTSKLNSIGWEGAIYRSNGEEIVDDLIHYKRGIKELLDDIQPYLGHTPETASDKRNRVEAHLERFVSCLSDDWLHINSS